MYELPKYGLVEQVERIVLSDDEFNEMIDQPTCRERGYTRLARDHPV
jgi:hypothetical protein